MNDVDWTLPTLPGVDVWASRIFQRYFHHFGTHVARGVIVEKLLLMMNQIGLWVIFGIFLRVNWTIMRSRESCKSIGNKAEATFNDSSWESHCIWKKRVKIEATQIKLSFCLRKITQLIMNVPFSSCADNNQVAVNHVKIFEVRFERNVTWWHFKALS